MNGIRRAVAFSTVAMILSGGVAFAQYHGDHNNDNRRADNRGGNHYVRHQEWRRGYHMNRNDWGRGQRVDYRRYHLNAPPRGYEWREVDGNYVMAAVATGVIASVIAAAAASR